MFNEQHQSVRDVNNLKKWCKLSYCNEAILRWRHHDSSIHPFLLVAEVDASLWSNHLQRYLGQCAFQTILLTLTLTFDPSRFVNTFKVKLMKYQCTLSLSLTKHLDKELKTLETCKTTQSKSPNTHGGYVRSTLSKSQVGFTSLLVSSWSNRQSVGCRTAGAKRHRGLMTGNTSCCVCVWATLKASLNSRYDYWALRFSPCLFVCSAEAQIQRSSTRAAGSAQLLPLTSHKAAALKEAALKRPQRSTSLPGYTHTDTHTQLHTHTGQYPNESGPAADTSLLSAKQFRDTTTQTHRGRTGEREF